MTTGVPIDGGDPEVLVEVAERHRRREPEPAAKPRPRAAKAEPEPAEDDAEEPRQRRKLAASKRDGAISTDTIEESNRPRAKAKPEEKAKPRAKAKAEEPKAKPRRAAAAPVGESPMWARLGAWGVAACAAALAIAVLTVDGLHEVPRPMAVGSVRISWLPGPQLPSREVLGWLDRFPGKDRLRDPNPWVLDQLATYLRSLPAVGEVRQVRLVHEPGAAPSRPPHRTLEVILALRQPVMPAVLATGERAWVDAEGRLLPGIVPGPSAHRPTLRQIESAKPGSVQAALDLWARLEPQIEAGTITDIALDDALDDRGARGIVLYARQGSRLIWGAPDEERYGVRAEAKARDLVHTMRCQGDLSRVSTINVRFSQPFFTFRD